ncbi:sterile alpha motif domain-containing protein 9-like [Rhinoraja longicauda]
MESQTSRLGVLFELQSTQKLGSRVWLGLSLGVGICATDHGCMWLNGPMDFDRWTMNRRSVLAIKPQALGIVLEPPSNHGTAPENIPPFIESGTRSVSPGVKPAGNTQCNPHPFDKEDAEFKYVKGHVLPVESGSKNLIIPCHEFKSFQIAARRNDHEQEVKFAKEVIKFAAACMNCRTNGTIHFGVEDGEKYKHGQILGVPVPKRELFVNARDKYIKKCFFKKHHSHAEHSIRPPRFVEVSDGGDEKHFVIEVDIVPSSSVVKDTFFPVTIPNLGDWVENPRRFCYTREGAACCKVHKMPEFIRDRDLEREKAERDEELSRDGVYQKLSQLFTSIKKHMNGELKYILVIDSCEKDLNNLGFLLRMKFFCVLDFDPNSRVQGLFNLYPKARSYFLEDCVTERGLLSDEIKKDSFHQTSWIFCNGQTSSGQQQPYDAKTWMERRRKHLANIISQICNALLPPGSFEVLFLLLSQANEPLAAAFRGFYAGTNGRNIKCILEGRESCNEWRRVLETANNREALNDLTIVGTRISHLDNMIQIVQSSWPTDRLLLHDDSKYEDLLPFLEVLSSNDASCPDMDPKDEEWQEEVRAREKHFYKGGNVSWMNFWLADNNYCGEIIKRDAYHKVAKHLNSLLKGPRSEPVTTVSIKHLPGSGGSTLARHILWDFRKRVRCATVNITQPAKSICGHAVKLQENAGGSILLLVEDCNDKYIKELELYLTISVARYSPKPNFILLHCKKSNSPGGMSKGRVTVEVHYKLSEREKGVFRKKLDDLKVLYTENTILTFALMTKEYNPEYLTKCVKELLESVDCASNVLELVRCIALINHYVGGSYITVPQCEVFINRGAQGESPQRVSFESLLKGSAGGLLSLLCEPGTEFWSVRIVHCKVAEEILSQVSSQRQSKDAALLLEEDVFSKHHAATQVAKFIRQLFVRRTDHTDTSKRSFPSLIEHVSRDESETDAEDLLKKACECFAKDAFVIQQLVRFLCQKKKFKQAESWIKMARSLEPSNSYILHTEGQVYHKWLISDFSLQHLIDHWRSPSIFAKAIVMALKAIDAFEKSQEASTLEADWNNAGYFGEIEVGCYVVNFMSELDVFKYKDGCYMNLVRYLLTEWIPDEMDTTWGSLHGKIKVLHDNIWKALESIHEYIDYFRADQPTEGSLEEKYFEKLSKTEKQFSSFFRLTNDQLLRPGEMQSLIPKFKKNICLLSGARFTNIFSLESENLKKIVELCYDRHEDYSKNCLENYILAQIALAIHRLPSYPGEVSKAELRELSSRLCEMCAFDESPVPYFIQVLLYWPEDKAERTAEDDECLIEALDTMNNLYKNKINDSTTRKKPTYPHVFLGCGTGFQRFIHSSPKERGNGTYRWEDLHGKLQCMEGWIENNKISIQGHCSETKISVHRGPKCLIQSRRSRVSFYLGFTLRGCLAYNVQEVSEEGASESLHL